MISSKVLDARHQGATTEAYGEQPTTNIGG